MGGVGINTVHAAWGDDADGRILFVQHIADLNRRGMGAQHVAVFHIKGILHGARGVVLRDIERLEVVEIVFDFGAVGHIEAHAVKEFDHALQGQGNRMQAAALLTAAGQSNVECLGGQLRLQFGGVKRIAFFVIGRLKTVFAFVDVRADGFLFFGRQAAELFQQGVQFAGFAHVLSFNEF